MGDESSFRRHTLTERFGLVRALTEHLAEPLSPEDQTVQTMPDVSPTKWHRGHTSWFFETFLLEPYLDGYVTPDSAYAYIFNSYYEAVGARHPRAQRGFISRPGAGAVGRYRQHVDAAMGRLMGDDLAAHTLDLIELGINHEQQHQELLLMDIKHVLSCNPTSPVYRECLPTPAPDALKLGWIEHRGGIVEIGHTGSSFGFDNEYPRHQQLLNPFSVADRAVTCGDWLDFIEDDGYRRPELWLSDGWAVVQQQGWEAPLYWRRADNGTPKDEWQIFSLGGQRDVVRSEPVCHVSYYEADAYAHWTGCRLPTEVEWEAVATEQPVNGHFLDDTTLHPCATAEPALHGDVWEWTSSAYCPYPGFRAPVGAVGEYNGKFMVNQYVLRGGSCVTPPGHVRATYRNFFPAAARWAFSGVRLARDD